MNFMNFGAFVYREWILLLRSKTDLWFALVPPLITVAFYTYAMSNTVPQIDGVPYLQFALPGIVMISILGNITVISSRVFNEFFGSVLLEYFSTPTSRIAYIIAKLVSILVFALVQGTVFLGAGMLAFGIRPSLLETLGALAVLALAGACLGSIFLFFGVWIRDMARFLITSNLLGQAMIWGSSAFYPLSALPPGLKWFAAVNPVTHGSELLRSLLVFHSSTNVESWVFLAVTSILFGTLAVRVLAKRVVLAVQS
ncbi:MAG: hypothetical protein C4332_13840 [Meiothermus sp.]|jgi:ABC-2 type transport system permease protein